MRRPLVIHPFLFAAFPVVFLFSHNVEQVSYSEVVLPLVCVLGLTFLALVCLGLILKDVRKVGFIVSICLVVFFSYGHIYDTIKGCQVAGHTIGRHRYVLVLWAELLIAGLYWHPRARSALYAATKVLNVISASVVVFSLLNIGLYAARAREPSQGRATDPTISVNPVIPMNASKLPDIYYIILDSYPNASTLRQIYGFDNSQFTDGLAERGFYVARESRSNYPQTFLSLASSLNMEYINYLTHLVGEGASDRAVPQKMIQESDIVDFLKSSGYRYVHFSSLWGPTWRNQRADIEVQCVGTPEFLRVLLQTTMLRPLDPYLAARYREHVLCTFSELAQVHRIEGPTFVFAHIVPPHPPYLFGRDGEPGVRILLTSKEQDPWQQRERYLNQLMFVNKKVEGLLDEILSHSEMPPIVILQGDHGPASVIGHTLSGQWNEPTEEMIRERTAILNAYYLPEGCTDFLYDSMTPVNTFRVLFNCCFDTDYPILEDKVYFSTYQQPYKFVDVSDIVTGE